MGRQTGRTPGALAGEAELPEDADYLWRWFCRLSGRRQGGMGPASISFPQMESFFRLSGIRPDEWELAALELLDNAWLNAQAEHQQKG